MIQIFCPNCRTPLNVARGTTQCICGVCNHVINLNDMEATQYAQAGPAPQPAAPQPVQYAQAPPAYVPQKQESSSNVLVIVLASLLAAIIGAGVVYFLINSGKSSSSSSSAPSTATTEQPAVVHDTVVQTQTIVQEAPAAPQAAPSRRASAAGKGLYPFASTRRLSYNELLGYTARQLKIMRNEIYARHGYVFQTADMKSYFAGQPWYTPISRNVSLSRIEQENVATIKSVEAIK